ncbi:MAG: glycosyltransferase family 39 protein [Desulfobacteraceae bacterium]|nr:glycosyltransferase family 39 protein [Desulfobacteraceae bacterium]
MDTRSSSHKISSGQILLVGAVTCALLSPFLGKAFHIDDTLFLKAAVQIRHTPWDFYGFPVNWYGWEMPMSEVNQNPPLVAYLIAGISALIGSNEVSLHIAFMGVAVAATLGAWRLARLFCGNTLAAALLLAVSPAFLVTSTNLMTDTTMLAFFLWGLACWMDGLNSGGWLACLLSVLFISLATLTKYFGIMALPLLGMLTIARGKRFDLRLLLLLLPLGTLFGFDYYTKILYGHGLFSSAAAYSSALKNERAPVDYWQKLCSGLSFTGGCQIFYLFYAPFLYPRRQLLLVGGVGMALVASLVLASGEIGSVPIYVSGSIRWPQLIQFTLFIFAGAAILVQSLSDCLLRRDSESLFLCCWIAGTFIFTTFVNWSTNARTVLPMVPAVAMVVVRQFEFHRTGRTLADSSSPPLWPLLPCAILSLMVAWADMTFANSQREAARLIMDIYGKGRGTVWFQGHWGFQYYMEQAGARPIDFNTTRIQSGDVLVVPENNTNTREPLPGMFQRLSEITLKSFPFLATMDSVSLGAGFYSDVWGALPFSFGETLPENYFIYSFVPH